MPIFHTACSYSNLSVCSSSIAVANTATTLLLYNTDISDQRWKLTHSVFAGTSRSTCTVHVTHSLSLSHTHTHTPVSYTHLDVYKRQDRMCVCACACARTYRMLEQWVWFMCPASDRRRGGTHDFYPERRLYIIPF